MHALELQGLQSLDVTITKNDPITLIYACYSINTFHTSDESGSQATYLVKKYNHKDRSNTTKVVNILKDSFKIDTNKIKE